MGAKLEDLGFDLFTDTWPLIASGDAPRIPQDHSQATYTVAARREHACIDWTKTAAQISNLCRAFTDGLGAWSHLGEKRLYVWKAEPYTGNLALEEKQPSQILGITGRGVLVQAGDGPVLLTETEVGRGGPDMLTYLGGMIDTVPVILE